MTDDMFDVLYVSTKHRPKKLNDLDICRLPAYHPLKDFLYYKRE